MPVHQNSFRRNCKAFLTIARVNLQRKQYTHKSIAVRKKNAWPNVELTYEFLDSAV